MMINHRAVLRRSDLMASGRTPTLPTPSVRGLTAALTVDRLGYDLFVGTRRVATVVVWDDPLSVVELHVPSIDVDHDTITGVTVNMALDDAAVHSATRVMRGCCPSGVVDVIRHLFTINTGL